LTNIEQEYNDYEDFKEDKKVKLDVCPKCGQSLESYSFDYFQYLVCKKCEYASDVTR